MRIRIETTRWRRGSTGNCTRKVNSTIQTNGIWTTQNLSCKMRHTNSLGFQDTNESSNLGQTTRPSDSQQKKKWICRIVDFAILLDHRVKLKENEKRDTYLDLTRELKKLWNIKVSVVAIVIGTLGTVTKGLVQGVEDLEIRGWVVIIQIIALLRSVRIVRRVLEIWEDLLSFKSQRETII